MDTFVRPLLAASVGFLVSSSVGTVLAVGQHLPANFAGLIRGNAIMRDFMSYRGTALSPPLVLLLIQAQCMRLVRQPGERGTLGVIGLTSLGALYTVGQSGEEIVIQLIAGRNRDVAQALLVTTNLLCSISMLIAGGLEWQHRYQE
jgi:hypothetical protein